MIFSRRYDQDVILILPEDQDHILYGQYYRSPLELVRNYHVIT